MPSAVLFCLVLLACPTNSLLAQQYSASDSSQLVEVETGEYQRFSGQESASSIDAEGPGMDSVEPLPTVQYWADQVHAGYDSGFVIASDNQQDLGYSDLPFRMRINGWGQLRHTIFSSAGANADANQFQLKRARLTFAGSAFTPDFSYFFQMDGRSSSGDDVRLLDYFLTYDFGHHVWGWEPGTFAMKTGKYKMPFTMARYLAGREFEFTDRAMSSTYFDVNRSLAWGLAGKLERFPTPLNWEVAIFNGLVSGGAETGSSGSLDDNFAYSARVFMFPAGEWGKGSLADLDWHETLATRIGAGFASSNIHRSGSTEFDALRVVDSGRRLRDSLPASVEQYTANLFSVDASLKRRGWSTTIEYYFRTVNNFKGTSGPNLYDHGFWLQLGKFVVPQKLQLISRWSRAVGNSGTLGGNQQSSDEVAGGFAWYIRDQNAKIVVDATYLNGAPINSAALDISPGDIGWLVRSQIQFAF